MLPGLILMALIGAAAGYVATRLMRVDVDLPTAMGIGAWARWLAAWGCGCCCRWVAGW